VGSGQRKIGNHWFRVTFDKSLIYPGPETSFVGLYHLAGYFQTKQYQNKVA